MKKTLRVLAVLISALLLLTLTAIPVFGAEPEEDGRTGSIRVTLSVAEESIQSRVVQMDESLYYDMLSAF